MTVAPFLCQHPVSEENALVRGARAGLVGAVCGVAAWALVGCGGGESYSPTLPVTTVVDYFPTVVNNESQASMRRGQQVDTTTGSLTGPLYGDTWRMCGAKPA